jgi:hypothetical protein
MYNVHILSISGKSSRDANGESRQSVQSYSRVTDLPVPGRLTSVRAVGVGLALDLGGLPSNGNAADLAIRYEQK